jgi:hypothetical protein
VSTEAGRLAAYADLVAALLDLRDPSPSVAFDAALDDLLTEGALTAELVRRLRLLQRATVRELVDHAQTVLPATLVALEGDLAGSAGSTEPHLGVPSQVDLPAAPPPVAPTAAQSAAPELPSTESTPEPPADLQARRLLVAGLRPLPDGPRRGTLP